MSDDHTPTDDDIKYWYSTDEDGNYDHEDAADFERWMSAHDARVRSVALNGHRCDEQAERAYRRAASAEEEAARLARTIDRVREHVTLIATDPRGLDAYAAGERGMASGVLALLDADPAHKGEHDEHQAASPQTTSKHALIGPIFMLGRGRYFCRGCGCVSEFPEGDDEKAALARTRIAGHCITENER